MIKIHKLNITMTRGDLLDVVFITKGIETLVGMDLELNIKADIKADPIVTVKANTIEANRMRFKVPEACNLKAGIYYYDIVIRGQHDKTLNWLSMLNIEEVAHA